MFASDLMQLMLEGGKEMFLRTGWTRIGSIRIAGLQKYTIISQILLFIIFHIPSAPYFQEACM